MSRFSISIHDPLMRFVIKSVGTILSALAVTVAIDRIRKKPTVQVAGDSDPIVETFRRIIPEE